MAIEGVDYAGTRPDPVLLHAAGKRFAVRYGGPGGEWKHLTAAELEVLNAAGLAVVSNAEGAASGLLGGFSVGADWARSADRYFRTLGMPADRPIYLSADWDVQPGQWVAVRDALRGAASVIGAGRVGIYGGLNAIQWARRDAVAAWYWQTYAWSGGRWAPGNQLEQYRNGVTLAGGTVDLCRALVADYGQWMLETGESDVDTAQNNALSDAWSATVAMRTGGNAPASTTRPAGSVWLVEAVKSIATAVDGLTTVPPGAVSDEQLERVLRKILRSIPESG